MLRILVTCLFLFCAGCSPPVTTVDLIVQAQQALVCSKTAIEALHQDQVKAINSQLAEADRMFDQDVLLVESGQLRDANNQPIKLTAAWVISERKGLSLAQSLLSDKKARATQAHGIDLDNVQAGMEALDMARTLIVMQQNLSANVKGWLMSSTGKLLKPGTTSTAIK